MKRNLVVFLKWVVAFIGVGAFIFLLWEPQTEGVNAHKTLFDIYFRDPFVWYAYAGSIPFFLAIYRAFRMLGSIGHGRVTPSIMLKELEVIKYCAAALIGFVAVGEIFILEKTSDDHAGGVFMGLLVITMALVMMLVAGRVEREVKNKK